MFLYWARPNRRSGTKSDSHDFPTDGIGFHVCRFNQHDSRDQSIPLNSQVHFLFHFISLHFFLVLFWQSSSSLEFESKNFLRRFFLYSTLIQLIAIFKTWREGGGEGCRVKTAHSVNVFAGSINRIFVARSIKIYHLNFNSLYTHKICTLFFFFASSSLFWTHWDEPIIEKSIYA